MINELNAKLTFNERGENEYDIDLVTGANVEFTLGSTLTKVNFDIVAGKLLVEFDVPRTRIHYPEQNGVTRE